VKRKDRNKSSYRRALKIALVVSLVAHGAVLAFGRMDISGWAMNDDGPEFVMLPAEELPFDRPLEVIEIAEAAEGEESSSAAISEAVASESSEPTGDATEPAESAAPRVVFTTPESARTSTVFLTTVSTDNTGPTLATDATIEDLLVKKPPETADGAGVDDEDQWASARTSRRRGGGIAIGIGGFGGGDTCGPGDRYITARVPLGTAGSFQPSY
jgi:hypothetical protein